MARFNAQAMQSCLRKNTSQPDNGLPVGTIIFTLDGALPVEYLSPGDRVITRAGAKLLRSIKTGVDGFILGFDKPETIFADGIEMIAA